MPYTMFQRTPELFVRNHNGVMWNTEYARGLCGIGYLRVRILIAKSHCKTWKRLPGLQRRRGDECGVDTSRKQHPDRHIGKKLLPHSCTKPPVVFFHSVVKRSSKTVAGQGYK